MFKNVASQKIALFAFDTTTGAPKTGDGANITPYVAKDYGTVTVLGTATATEMDATNAKGWYSFVLTQAETNADALLFTGKSSTSNISIVGALIFSTPPNFSALLVSASGHISNVDTLTTYTGNTPQTGDNFARLGAPAGASVSADIAAVKSDTGTVLTDVNTGAGAIYTRLGAPAGASIAADVAAVKTDTAAVKVQTDKLTFTVSNQVDANPLSLNGDATAAANIAKTTRAIGRATASGVPTTTSIPTSACTPAGAVADQFKGRIITFDANTTSTALRGQATDITASSNSATPTFTVTALTTAPAAGDTFSIT